MKNQRKIKTYPWNAESYMNQDLVLYEGENNWESILKILKSILRIILVMNLRESCKETLHGGRGMRLSKWNKEPTKNKKNKIKWENFIKKNILFYLI